MDFEARIDLSEVANKVKELKDQAQKIVIGQERLIDLFLIAIFGNGHILVEGVPGIAKTLTAKLIAKMIDADYKRLQFTPDLMPSDVLGTSVFNQKTSEFYFKKGPIFTNILLIDEINRAPAKTQSALFEAMEERQITNDGVLYPFDPLFTVIGTQNPIEQEGTYKLPEGQLDRFLFKVNVSYPKQEEEARMLGTRNKNRNINSLEAVNKILTKENIYSIRQVVDHVVIEEKLIEYIVNLIGETRNSPSIYLGASPRASLDLMNASKAYAAIQNRDFVTPEDIKYLFEPVIAHRIILASEAELEGLNMRQVCEQLLKRVEIP